MLLSVLLFRTADNCFNLPRLKILRRAALSVICSFLDSEHLHIRSLQRLLHRCLSEDTSVALANESILARLLAHCDRVRPSRPPAVRRLCVSSRRFRTYTARHPPKPNRTTAATTYSAPLTAVRSNQYQITRPRARCLYNRERSTKVLRRWLLAMLAPGWKHIPARRLLSCVQLLSEFCRRSSSFSFLYQAIPILFQ